MAPRTKGRCSSHDEVASSDAGPPRDGDAAAGTNGDGSAGVGPCADAGRHRLMFVTQALLGASFGGQVAAANLCTAFAVDAGLPGSYVAWLSTITAPPGPNLDPKPGVPILLPDCERLAVDLDHLMTSTGIEVTLDVTERGLQLGGSDCSVWTSTLPNGAPIGDKTCADWTSAEAGVAFIGRCEYGPDAGDPGFWTRFPAQASCDSVARLYCIQN